MKPARNTRRSPANWPPPKLAGSNFVARTTTPKRPIRIPATLSRDTVSPKKKTMRIAMNTMFTLTRRAVFDAVVRRMPSFWRSKPIAFTAPRIHTIGSRKMLRSRRPIAARTSSPREAPRAIRAKVRNSGSTLSTVSLLPGNEVPQRTLARRIRPTSRRREAIGRPEEAMGHMRFAAERPRRPGGLYDPAGRLPRADGRGAASPRLRDHPDRGRDRRIRLPSDSTAAGRRDARGGHRSRALHPRVFRPSARGRRPGRPRRGLPDVTDRAFLRHPGLSETRRMAVPARDFRGGRVVPRRTGARPRVRLGVPARDLPRAHPHLHEHDVEPEAPRGLWLRSGPRGGPHHGLDPDRRHRRPVADDVRGGPGVAVAAPAAVRPRRAPWHPGPRGPAHLCGKPRPPAGPSRDGRGLAEQRDHGRAVLRPPHQLRLRRPRLAAPRRRLLRREHRREHGIWPAGLPPHHAGRRRLHGRVLREHRFPDQPLDDPRRPPPVPRRDGCRRRREIRPRPPDPPTGGRSSRGDRLAPRGVPDPPGRDLPHHRAIWGDERRHPDLLAVAMAVMIGTAVLPSPLVERAKRRLAAAEAAQ